MIASILIPVIFLSIFLTNSSLDYYNDYISPVIEQNISKDISKIEEFFLNSENELNTYAHIINLKEDETYIFSILDEFIENNNTFTQAYFSKETGGDYMSGSIIPPVDGRTRSWYETAKKEAKFNISEPYIDLISEEWVITLSIPIYRNDAFYGVFGVDFLIKDIVNHIAKVTELTQSRYVVKDNLGAIIYFDNSVGDKINAEKLLNSKNIVYHYLENLEMSIYIISSFETYENSISSISQDMAVLFLFLLGMTVLIAMGISNNLTTPLNAFKEKIIQLKNSTTSINKIDGLHWDEEFFELFTAFNRLAKIIELDREKLSYRIEILEKKNEKLIEKNIDLEDNYRQLKLLDNKLRKSRKDYESILDNIKGLVWVLDANGQISFVNIHLREALAYSSDDIIGADCATLLDPIYYDEIKIFDLLQTRDFKRIELFLKDSDGQSISVEANTSRVHDDQGNLLYIYGICRDSRPTKELHYNYSMKIEEQNLIMELTETASMNVSLSQVTKAIFDKINNIFGWSQGTIRFLNEENEFELMTKSEGQSDYIADYPLRSDYGCLQHVVEHGEALYVYKVEDLPVKEKIYSKIIRDGNAIIFIPVGNYDIGKGVISITIDRNSIQGKKDLLKSFTNTILIVVERALIYEKLKQDYIRMIKVLAEAGDDKDSSSVGHSNRVAAHCKLIAEKLYLEDSEIIDLEICGLLHDIGKIGISDEYLSESTQNDEYAIEKVKDHPRIGRDMLEGIGLSVDILDGIEMHHLNYDLTGYPVLEGVDSLPLFPRIIQVADQYDNYKVSGLYKNNIQIWEAMNVFTGQVFCPQIMRIFKEIIIEKSVKSEEF